MATFVVCASEASSSRAPNLGLRLASGVTSGPESGGPAERRASLTIGAVQPALRPPDRSPVASAARAADLVREAAAERGGGVDLFVLPELAPLGYSEDTFEKYLPKVEEATGAIDGLFSDLAKELKCYICYGTVGTVERKEQDEGSRQLHTIRQNVMGDNGELVCYYDKIHLCDYGDCSETRFFVSGSELKSFDCRGFRVGIIICADMRNPTLCRRLAGKAHGCDVILQPAAFSRDISFRTWRSFRETRAVENSVYFVAVNYAGENFGETSFVGPWVDECNEPKVLGTEEAVLVGEARADVLARVRRNFPYHRQLMGEDVIH